MTEVVKMIDDWKTRKNRKRKNNEHRQTRGIGRQDELYPSTIQLSPEY
jgi:hypothetical protein